MCVRLMAFVSGMRTFDGCFRAFWAVPARGGHGLGHFQKPVDLVPAFSPDAQKFGFLSRRQDNPLRRKNARFYARSLQRYLGHKPSKGRTVGWPMG
jgi:hypothetical protein